MKRNPVTGRPAVRTPGRPRVRIVALLVLGALPSLLAAQSGETDDFRWIHGANYTPSYAATDVETWLRYDPDTIDRELGLAKSIGLNTVRVFLQSLVYHHDPDRFLANFEHFLSAAASHDIKVMPILFDSCFGIAPSLESQHVWVANPGPDRMGEEFWPESNAYVRALVGAHLGDERIVMWDVMNEPTATTLMHEPGGPDKIKKFLRHNLELVKQVDPTHAVTVGIAGTDASDVIDLIDVVSIHSYAPTHAEYIQALELGRRQAEAVGKPWIITETGAPGWGNTYEMIMPILRDYDIGHVLWEVVIGKNQFRHISGLLYPDGSARRIDQIEAIMNAPATFLTEKPDDEGSRFGSNQPGNLPEYLRFVTRDAVTDSTWSERSTLAFSMIAALLANHPRKAGMFEELQAARAAYRDGEKAQAFETVGALVREGAEVILARDDDLRPPRAIEATVHRDVFGVPHIFADTEEAGAFALAQAMCEDYSDQVFENLRMGVGRSAEVLGESVLDRDRNVHLWRIPEIAQMMWDRSPPRTRRLLEAFADGLNAYRADHPEETRFSLEATPIQVLALSKYFVHSPSLRILEVDASTTLRLRPAPESPTGQSSTFVIGGSRTASGHPILMIDPHWPAEGTHSWYEFHLTAGRLDIGGFAMPGMPFALLGYTPGATWGGTAGGADSGDVFELEIHPNNPDHYLFDGEWRAMDTREARVWVKTADGIEQRRFTFRETVHGPVVEETDGRVFAGAVCGWKDTGFVEQFLEMNRAKNKQEFLNAVGEDQLTWVNLTYATADGDIGYVQTGCAPLRPERPGRELALDGTRSSAMWQGVVPFDQLPQVHNPAADWIQNCNTAANTVTEGLQLKASDFPPGVVYGHYSEGPVWRGRGERATEVLTSMRGATLEEAKDLAFDTTTMDARYWAAPLVAAYDARRSTVEDPLFDLRAAADAVRNWDHRVVKESTGATVFHFWREEYHKLRPEAFGAAVKHKAFPQSPDEQTDAFKALQAAVERMRDLYGSVLVPWGRVLRLRRHGLDLPLDGSPGGVWGSEVLRSTGGSAMNEDGQIEFRGGQVVTTVVELTDPIRVWSIAPWGQSRKKGAVHATDQMRLYSAGEMRPTWHDWASLRDQIETSRTYAYKLGK